LRLSRLRLLGTEVRDTTICRDRFETLGELVAEIYKTINYYNRSRIHTSLGMTSLQFATKNSMEYVVGM